MTIGWMCGVRLGDRITDIELCRRLDMKEVVAVMRRRRLRWFGHMEHERVSDWVSAYRSILIEWERLTGRNCLLSL